MRKGLKLLLITIFIFTLFSIYISAAPAVNDSGAYIYQEGIAGGVLEYKFMLNNRERTAHQYQLFVEGLPAGYRYSISSKGTEIDNLELSAGKSVLASIRVNIPDKPDNTALFFKLIIQREDSKKEILPLGFNINEDYRISFVDYPGEINILSGQSHQFTVTIRNIGGKELKNVRLKFELPPKWLIEGLKPSSVNIKPGESASFQMDLFVPASQSAAIKDFKATAYNKDFSTTSKAGTVIVRKSSMNLLWMAVVIIALVLGTLYYFKKFGRR